MNNGITSPMENVSEKFKLTRDAVQLSRLVDVSKQEDVYREVLHIVSLMCPSRKLKALETIFPDIIKLFEGQFPGYQKCNTAYHDQGHTMAVFLAMARLLHGACGENIRFTEREILLGLISALMHDTGYIQTADDRDGTGAKYTLNHIYRSIDFVNKYFSGNNIFNEEIINFSNILHCTGLNVKISELPFVSDEIRLLGQMMGTADLLGQMSERLYIEKLPILYHEFVEGQVPGFESEWDLMKKTPGFYKMTVQRLEGELGNVKRFMIHHLRERWNINQDLYARAIENNILYLRHIIQIDHEVKNGRLRRSGVPSRTGNL